MGKAITSADLDSDHNLRNEKLSELIETSTAKATSEGSEPVKDPDPKKTANAKAEDKSKDKQSGAQASNIAKATSEGSE
ncbi:hypothetical protein [Leptospira meyeri]|uniref:hypothetical protein n=1 Tax=Leptospira meyeri TaxID=29508 RepID=UPI0010843BA1|nr:hypothetical protein [Leptospira meyeri]TGM21996.1 hypothetical protein EHQ73_09375 [Leptospira meyeri]